MEVWRDIIGYEDKYQISNKGRVRTLGKSTYILDYKKRKRKHTVKSIIRKQCMYESGRTFISLYKNSHNRTHCVDELVFINFIKRDIDLTRCYVKHLNGDNSDNTLENLVLVEGRRPANRPATRKSKRKLSNEDIKTLKELREKESNKYAARFFDITESYASQLYKLEV